MNTADLDLIISRLREGNQDVQAAALNALHDEVRSSQGSSFTEIQNLYDRIDSILECLECLETEKKRHLYDLLSVISIMGDTQHLLGYRLNGCVTDLSVWGHQYVRKLVSAIVDVSTGRSKQVDYTQLVEPIISFLFTHNSEIEAIDFAIEVSGLQPCSILSTETSDFVTEIKSILDTEKEDIKIGVSPKMEEIIEEPAQGKVLGPSVLELIFNKIDDDNRGRVVVYLEELAKFYGLTELILKINEHDPSRYLVTLIKHRRMNDAVAYVKGLKDQLIKKQCLYILARCCIQYNGSESDNRILNNSHMAGIFRSVAESLEVLPPKKVDNMFKSLNKDKVDIAAVANALVHFGYGRDPIFFPQEGDYQVKEEHLSLFKSSDNIAVVASAGLLHAFDPQSVYALYEPRILDSPDIGAVLAVALSAYKTGDADTVILNLLSIFLTSGNSTDTIASLFAISLLYNSSHRQEVYDLIFPLLSSADNNVALFSIYVLGCVFPGDIEILASCVEVYSELKKDPLFTNFALLGIAIFFYQLDLEPGSDVASVFDRLTPHARVLARGFMGLGSGDPGVVDKILAEAFIGDIDTLLESLGLLAACMVGVGDNVAIQLIERISTSSLMLDSPHLKNIIPFCLAMLYTSNMRTEVVDTLERSINSGECSVNAIIAIGIVGAGTCSSRILRILDSSFSSLYKDPRASAALVYARGLVCLGKGLFTLSPLCYDKQVILPRSFISLISTLFLFLENGTSFKDYSYFLYLITGAVLPRYVHTDCTDSDLKESEDENISVRIGRPVDIVGKAGKPNKISATVVHTLPAILNENERAEADIALCTSFVEDVIVPRKDIN